MTGAARYNITELVEKTGVPATTIHHYRRAGLLPPPEAVGANRFRYADSHVQALRLVRLLRDRRRLSLPAIREVLPDLLAGGDEEAFTGGDWEAALTQGRAVSDGTRDRIVAAAVELFTARGYAEVAVGDVAARAGIAKGSVYRHFQSKDELFAAAVEAVVAGVVDEVGAWAAKAGGRLDPADAITALLVAARPGATLLLELAAGSLRDVPGHRALADAVLTRFVEGIGPLLTGPGSPRERAASLVVRLARDTMSAVLGAS